MERIIKSVGKIAAALVKEDTIEVLFHKEEFPVAAGEIQAIVLIRGLVTSSDDLNDANALRILKSLRRIGVVFDQDPYYIKYGDYIDTGLYHDVENDVLISFAWGETVEIKFFYA